MSSEQFWRLDIYVHHIFDEPIPVTIAYPRTAAKATLSIATGAEHMAAQLTVDDVNKRLVVQFLDDKGDTDAAPPTGNDGQPVAITFTSSDDTVISLAMDPNSPTEALMTISKEGTASLSADITSSDGSAVMEPDGVTPFAVTPVDVTVGPGLAVSAQAEVE